MEAKMFQEPTIVFDKEKLKDVVHYVCSKCEPLELGHVKLHKILYLADMLHYHSTLCPLTGVEYLKQSFGPGARHLTWALFELEKEGRVRVDRRDYFGFEKQDFVSISPPAMGRLGNSAPQLLDDVIDFVCSRATNEIGELKHNAAWKTAKMGEVIPYFTALALDPAELSDDDLAWGVAEAQRISADIEAEFSAR
jgi:Protein of unknown function (DUF4065)